MELVKNIFSLDPLFLNRLLRQDSLEKGVRAIKLTIIALCFFILVLVIREVVVSLLAVSTEISAIKNAIGAAPISTGAKQKSAQPDYRSLRSQAILGTFDNKPKNTQAAKPISTLALNLIGTFITTGESPYAIIEDDKKKTQDVFNIKDRVFDEATLVAIYSDRVDIERNGKIEVLKMDLNEKGAPGSKQSTGISEVGSDEFVVDETELNAAIENLPLVLTQARAVPYFKDGKSVGLRMFAIRSGSIYEKIGLKNGDILKSVNGQSLADLTQAVKLFEKLKEERSVNVVLERDRQDRDFKYQIR